MQEVDSKRRRFAAFLLLLAHGLADLPISADHPAAAALLPNTLMFFSALNCV